MPPVTAEDLKRQQISLIDRLITECPCLPSPKLHTTREAAEALYNKGMRVDLEVIISQL